MHLKISETFNCTLLTFLRCLGLNEAMSCFRRLCEPRRTFGMAPALRAGNPEISNSAPPCREIQWFSTLFAYFVCSCHGKPTIYNAFVMISTKQSNKQTCMLIPSFCMQMFAHTICKCSTPHWHERKYFAKAKFSIKEMNLFLRNKKSKHIKKNVCDMINCIKSQYEHDTLVTHFLNKKCKEI